MTPCPGAPGPAQVGQGWRGGCSPGPAFPPPAPAAAVESILLLPHASPGLQGCRSWERAQPGRGGFWDAGLRQGRVRPGVLASSWAGGAQQVLRGEAGRLQGEALPHAPSAQGETLAHQSPEGMTQPANATGTPRAPRSIRQMGGRGPGEPERRTRPILGSQQRPLAGPGPRENLLR